MADALLTWDWTPSTVEDMPDLAAAVDANRRAILYIPGQILFHHGHYDEARPRLRALVDGYRGTQESCYAAGLLVESSEREGDLASARQLTSGFSQDPVCPDQERQEAFDLNRHHQPRCPSAAQSRRESATAMDDATFERACAAEEFLLFAERYPDSEHVPAALFNAANNYQIIGQTDRADELFAEYVRRFPDHDESRALTMHLAARHEAAMELEEAIALYDELVRRFPDSEEAPDALFQASYLREGLGRTREAALDFERYATEWERADAPEVS